MSRWESFNIIRPSVLLMTGLIILAGVDFIQIQMLNGELAIVNVQLRTLKSYRTLANKKIAEALEISSDIGEIKKIITELKEYRVPRTPENEGDAPWTIQENWEKVTKDMTREEVEFIMGPPTSVSPKGKVLFAYYEGDVESMGDLSITIEYVDQKVTDVRVVGADARFQN